MTYLRVDVSHLQNTRHPRIRTNAATTATSFRWWAWLSAIYLLKSFRWYGWQRVSESTTCFSIVVIVVPPKPALSCFRKFFRSLGYFIRSFASYVNVFIPALLV